MYTLTAAIIYRLKGFYCKYFLHRLEIKILKLRGRYNKAVTTHHGLFKFCQRQPMDLIFRGKKRTNLYAFHVYGFLFILV